MEALAKDWSVWGRTDQHEPGGAWFIWLILAGRGWGKTRTGAEAVRSRVERGRAGRVALVARTVSDARDVMVEGESGILACSPSYFRPTYEPSKRRLTWPNGAIATTYTAEEPKLLRGPQHDFAWADEPAAWDKPDSFDQMLLGLRLGSDPRAVLTTTPKNVQIVRQLVEEAQRRLEGKGGRVVITRGRTMDNAANLAGTFLDTVVARYAGTRLGRQELEGALLLDTPGALWTSAMFVDGKDSVLARELPDEMARVVVAVDPPGGDDHKDMLKREAEGTAGDDARAECGIVGAGLGADQLGYVLADRSTKGSPEVWARAAVQLYRELQADYIVAEINYGGAMVEHTIHTIDKGIRVVKVNAKRGKFIRAEPVASLYEQKRVRHAVIEYAPDADGVWIPKPRNDADKLSHLALLEDQLTTWTPGKKSPDRLDAMVYALSELLITAPTGYSKIR